MLKWAYLPLTYKILLLRNKRLKLPKFCIPKRVKELNFLFGRNDCFEEETNHADLPGDVNY